MDKSDFRLLFDQHYRPLCNYAYRIVGDMDEAEDVVQEVFVKLWSQRSVIQINKSPAKYIYSMVRNQALSFIRRTSVGSKIKENMLNLQAGVALDEMDDEEIEKYLLMDKIYNSIRQLPPKCGEIFIMSKVNGLTYTQIAESLNISVKTVENQMSKALKLLRNMLANKMPILFLFIMWF